MPERLECEVLQKARYINTLTFTFTFTEGNAAASYFTINYSRASTKPIDTFTSPEADKWRS